MKQIEAGYFDSSKERLPSSDLLRNGSYKYIFFVDGTVIMSADAGIGHKDLIIRPFDTKNDDAGLLYLKWAMSPEKIEKRVKDFQELNPLSFDAEQYRNQLLSSSSKTTININPNYGSATLSYTPNPIARAKFVVRLGQLFPDAVISLEG